MPEKAPPSRQSQTLLSVYEIANTTQKEFLIWIGADAEGSNGIAHPPHWTPEDHVVRNTVGSGLAREDALSFRENYAKNLRHLPGWNIRLLPL
jgi:hypothetical protein